MKLTQKEWEFADKAIRLGGFNTFDTARNLEDIWDKIKDNVKPEEPEEPDPKDWRPRRELIKIRHHNHASDSDHECHYESPQFARMTFFWNILQLQEELNEGWKLNWRDSEQQKHGIKYDHSAEKWVNWVSTYKNQSSIAYFKDRDTHAKALAILNAADWAKAYIDLQRS